MAGNIDKIFGGPLLGIIPNPSYSCIAWTGFLIPKGWRIYVYTRETNYDSFTYPDPLTFNPWRWMVSFTVTLFHQILSDSLSSCGSNNFLDLKMQDKCTENNSFIFGGGTRLCPGKELGIAEISTFLHYFVTRYRSVTWKNPNQNL